MGEAEMDEFEYWNSFGSTLTTWELRMNNTAEVAEGKFEGFLRAFTSVQFSGPFEENNNNIWKSSYTLCYAIDNIGTQIHKLS